MDQKKLVLNINIFLSRITFDPEVEKKIQFNNIKLLE